MANFKRGRAKNRRAGCLLCKPHKANGAKGALHNQTRQEQKSRVDESEELFEQGQIWCLACKDAGCVWCGLACPDGQHDWESSDLEGSQHRRCRICLADGFID